MQRMSGYGGDSKSGEEVFLAPLNLARREWRALEEPRKRSGPAEAGPASYTEPERLRRRR